jgi:hypothetical protein
VAYGWDGVHSPVKPGYKNVKYLTRVAFLPEERRLPERPGLRVVRRHLTARAAERRCSGY